MKLSELIQRLQDYAEEHEDSDPEVRIMSQENYPFENRLQGICTLSDLNDEDEEEPGFRPAGENYGRDCPDDLLAKGIIYLVEGSQLGYGTQAAWKQARADRRY